MEVRQLASDDQLQSLTVLVNQGNISVLILPAAAIGAAGCRYTWWKGLSFSDLMNVTKSNMANVVSSMMKQLHQVTAALALKKFLNLKILLLNVELELKSEKENAEIRLSDPLQYQSVFDAEWNIIYDKLDKRVQSRAKIVLS